MTDLSAPHISRIEHAHERIDRLEPRVSSLERAGDVASERLRHIQQSVDSIQTGISRLVWLIAAGFVAAAIAFIVRGGLAP